MSNVRSHKEMANTNKHRLEEDSGATGTNRSSDLVRTLNPTALFLLEIHMSVSALPFSSPQSLGNDMNVLKKQQNTYFLHFFSSFYISFLVLDYYLGIYC